MGTLVNHALVVRTETVIPYRPRIDDFQSLKMLCGPGAIVIISGMILFVSVAVHSGHILVVTLSLKQLITHLMQPNKRKRTHSSLQH